MGRNKGKDKAQVPRAARSSSETWTLIHPPYLYLGPCSAASSPTFLNHEGITHILSIGKTPKECFPNITYERIPLTDEPDSLIAPSIAIAVKFIDAVRATGNKVFVHCSAAISRSSDHTRGIPHATGGDDASSSPGHGDTASTYSSS
ncbi:hypothetical protein BS47DRAFT_1486864 [Hydnum rufescens UP504]|uniref:protein-tyrosine-phosphatase n=1 Tax=Hydnum rufescens UP504 TaxID=1448309 RepID=A0A9P6AT24_9AGAM|nr:hypothetical protein BS47DRAFT_1486864 [Hydnum rufescens UP504]